MNDSDEREWAALHRLAKVLDVPTEQFFTGPPQPVSAVSADECLRLWSRIKTPEGRLRALEALRVIAATEPT
jgi:hypothetical protein